MTKERLFSRETKAERMLFVLVGKFGAGKICELKAKLFIRALEQGFL